MPLVSKNESPRKAYKNHYINNRSESKKIILIELTPVIIILTFAFVKTVQFFRPQDLSVHSLQEFLSSVLSWSPPHPLLAGALVSFITWNIMYFDSAVPGIDPPTPLSPSKYRALSGADYHLNYLFAMAVGPLVATWLYIDCWK